MSTCPHSFDLEEEDCAFCTAEIEFQQELGELAPGIRGAVSWFRDKGWNVIGSNVPSWGPGSTNVMVDVEDEKDLVGHAFWLYLQLHGTLSKEAFELIDVLATYNPRDGIASILVTGKGLLDLKPEEPEAIKPESGVTSSTIIALAKEKAKKEGITVDEWLQNWLIDEGEEE